MYGNFKGVSLIIEKDIDLDTKDNGGQTSLGMAIRYKKWEIASLLIKKGADINAKDKSGQAFLHIALEKGQLDAASFLIKNGTDVNVKDDKHGSAQFHYIVYGEKKSAGIKCNKSKTAQKCTKKKRKIWEEKLKIIDQLIDAGADINSQNKYGNTPLYSAVSLGNTKMLSLLIKKGADVNAKLDHEYENKNFGQKYILHLAIYNKRHEAARI